MRSGAFAMSSGCVRHCPVIYGCLRQMGGKLLESGVDPLAGAVLLAHDAFCVHAQQNGHAVPSPFGHLGCRYPGVQPERDAGVPEVVRPPSER